MSRKPACLRRGQPWSPARLRLCAALGGGLLASGLWAGPEGAAATRIESAPASRSASATVLVTGPGSTELVAPEEPAGSPAPSLVETTMAAPASSPVSAAIETTAVPSAGMVGTGGGAQDAVPGAPITTRTASLEDVASSGEARRVLRRLELLRALDLAFDEALRSPKLAPILLVHLRAAAAEVGLVLVDPDSLGRRGPRWLREEAGQAWEDLWLTWIQQLTAALGDPAAMGRGTLPLPGPAVWRRYLEARDAAPPPLAEVLLARVLAVSGALEAAGFAGWDDLLPGVGPAIVFRALYDDPLRFEWPRLDLLGEVGTRLRPALAEGQGLPDLRVVASRGLQAAEEGAKGPPDLADLLRALWRGEAEAVAKVRSPLFPDQADLRRVGERVLERYRAARNQALAEGGALVPGGDATERYLVEVIEGRLLPGIPARTEALAAGPVPQAPALDETIESAPSMMETTARGTGSEEASVAATSVSTAPALVPVGVPAVRPPSAPQSPSPSPAPSPSPPAAATPAPEEPAGSEDEVAEENPRGVGAGPSPEGGEEPAGHWWIQVRRAATRHPQRAGGVVLGALLLWALIRAVRRGRAGPTPREGTGKTTVLAISDETIPDVSGTQVSQPDQGSFDTIVESATPIPRSDVSPNRRTRGDDSAHGAWGAAAGEDGLAAGEVPTWLRHALQGALGERYDQYYLLGSGGMGCVVRAWDQRLHRQVAVKVPPPHLATDTHFRERFLREARALARLQHPNIAIVHDIPDVTAREIPVMILEYLEGQDLSEVLRAKGPLPLHDVAHWIDQAADGIQHAHDQGIFHRDLKPANLMVLHNGRLKVLDFGLASVGGHQRITRSGVLMGSLPYMAPEQMRGETVDARADVFSLGVTTYEILAGALPFHADDSGRLNPIPIERVRDDLPVEVVVVLRQVLGADPGRRFSSVQAFQRAFEKAAGLTPRRKLTTR